MRLMLFSAVHFSDGQVLDGRCDVIEFWGHPTSLKMHGPPFSFGPLRAGNSVSTFAALAMLERRRAGQWAAYYNGGNVPLTFMLPGQLCCMHAQKHYDVFACCDTLCLDVSTAAQCRTKT